MNQLTSRFDPKWDSRRVVNVTAVTPIWASEYETRLAKIQSTPGQEGHWP